MADMAPQLCLYLCVLSLLRLSLLPPPCSAAPAPAAGPAALVPAADFPSACRCTREINMVCANDGHTYSNKCMLNCARATGASSMGKALRIVKMGEC